MIRWPLIVFALIACVNRAYAFTPEQAARINTIADRLDPIACPATPQCAGVPTVLTRSEVNAWSDGHWIAVTSAMLEYADDDELAFIIGHEMAHNLGEKGERQADRRGQDIATMAGYDPNAGHRLMKRLDNPLRALAALTSFQPTPGQRAKALSHNERIATR